MAPTLRRKYLTCFYCNKKSDIKYDGTITEWECLRCDAHNYLDGNGEIRDPPVATYHASPPDLTYAVNRPTSPLSQISSQASDSFCATCLKNQHLYTASLAQFHVEIDPSHPNYKESEKQYYKYRASLEKLYPQCCVDCEPMAVALLNDSSKTAKSDYARRLMSKSRARRLAERTSRFTIGDAFDLIGRLLWFLGLILQLLWNGFTAAQIAENQYSTTLDSLPPYVTTLLSIASTMSCLSAGKALGYWGLWCTALSLWWSPKFKNLNRGFMNQVSGYGDWYKHQLFLFALRLLFYFIMQREHFAHDFAAPTQTAHAFVGFFILALWYRSIYFIKVDMNKLWDNPPNKLPFVGPSGSPKQTGNAMEDILSEIGTTRSSQSKSAFTASPPLAYRKPFVPQPYIPGSIRVANGRPAVPMQPLKELDLTEFRRRNSPPIFNNSCTTSSHAPGVEPSLHQQYSGHGYEDSDSMDWSPAQPLSQPKSKHRAFTENLPVDKDAEFFGRVAPREPTKLFGQTPVASERGAFWYKVPPAPLTPARQARNPPNQPSMRVASQERKESFFNNVTGRSSSIEPLQTTSANQGSQRQGIEFAQQKFFPAFPSEEPNELIESFGSWSLGDSKKPKTKIEKKRTGRHIWQGVTLLLALLFFHQMWKVSSG